MCGEDTFTGIGASHYVAGRGARLVFAAAMAKGAVGAPGVAFGAAQTVAGVTAGANIARQVAAVATAAILAGTIGFADSERFGMNIGHGETCWVYLSDFGGGGCRNDASVWIVSWRHSIFIIAFAGTASQCEE